MTWWAPTSSVLDLGPSEARGKGVDCYIQTPKSQFWKFQSKTCSIKRISISTCPQRFVDLPRLWWFNPLWRERHAYFSFFENEWIFDCTLHFSKILLFTWHHLTGLLYTVGVQLPTFFSRDHLLQEFFKDCEKIKFLSEFLMNSDWRDQMVVQLIQNSFIFFLKNSVAVCISNKLPTGKVIITLENKPPLIYQPLKDKLSHEWRECVRWWIG